MKDKKFVAKVRSLLRDLYGDEEFTKTDMVEMLKIIVAGGKRQTKALAVFEDTAASANLNPFRKRDRRILGVCLGMALTTLPPETRDYLDKKISFKKLLSKM